MNEAQMSPGMHCRFEKAGLVLDHMPIPWNADAILVEANLRLRGRGKETREQFSLAVGEQRFPAESLVHQLKGAPARLTFRLPVPENDSEAELRYRETPLGRLGLPILSRQAFLQSVRLETPTLQVQMKRHCVPCQSFVGVESRSLLATGLLRSAHGLASMVDLDLHVEVLRGNDVVDRESARFSASQLRGKEALLALGLPKPTKSGSYCLRWRLESDTLVESRFQVITRTQFLKSLRLSATRFVIRMPDGKVRVVRTLPKLPPAATVSACFFIASHHASVAGLAKLTVSAPERNHTEEIVSGPYELLVTEGPTPLIAEPVRATHLSKYRHFAIATSDRVLGILPIDKVPTANFTAEGGFEPLDDFVWSSAAEDELQSRLAKLLG